MKRFLIISSCAAIVAVFSCSDEVAALDRVITKADPYNVRAPILVVARYADDLSAPLAAEILSPVFTSNFNRLVVFAELGSSALLEGYKAESRGPPESISKGSANVITRTNYRLTDSLRFSLRTWTRLS